MEDPRSQPTGHGKQLVKPFFLVLALQVDSSLAFLTAQVL
jgi:hypothetical protein